MSEPEPVVPVNISFLNEALLPLYGSFYGTAFIINFFDCNLGWLESIIDNHTEGFAAPLTKQDLREMWQERLSDYCNEKTIHYRDPESLQAAQVLRKLDPLAVWSTLESHLRSGKIGGNTFETWESMGRKYINPLRGTNWLVECALMGLSQANIPEEVKLVVRQDLRSMVTCRPRYSRRCNVFANFGDPAPELFGPGGTLWPAMERFSGGPQYSSGIRHLLMTVMKEILTVVHLWTAASVTEGRPSNEMPTFKWYIDGFLQAHSAFISEVEDYNPHTQLPFHVREGEKDLRFDLLWDWVWNLAYEVHSRPGVRNTRQSFVEMCNVVMQQAQESSADPRPGMPEGFNVRSIVAKIQKEGGSAAEFAGRLYDRARQSTIFDEQRMMHQDAEPQLPEFNWGSRFYINEPVSDTEEVGSDELHDDDDDDEMFDTDFDEPVELEAFGPCTELEPIANTVTAMPPNQYCTICIEVYTNGENDMRIVRLNACAHYFHYACLWSWANGTSPNRNLCPECRTQFSEVRRSVRRRSVWEDASNLPSEEVHINTGADEEVHGERATEEEGNSVGTAQAQLLNERATITTAAAGRERIINDYSEDIEENGQAEEETCPIME
ncbi:hypothetical protein IAQ61_003049 [Plenodomus lingam]|uniref:RING-type domain-containing protein n=1 Tax=Leptosphaeria maculans (strain JN3 / isolate v23.1.3 / race Av1-4-5-6-7-8) TaxID=985895 RepID=E5ADE4_LEPMJ|nr:hypothetical protein LEMA_P000200.1 [Plenodomus lingam JN3]KAH9875585.1 hypothetical protein IAQ61_003049 [Plenodomus lingam]CBY01233.1 hypothetical protein LEMA_P000200.1 [Plenodomus lingam JN3]